MQGRVYAPGDAEDKMAEAIKEFNDFVIKDDRVEVVALPFRDGVNIVQRRYAAERKLCCSISKTSRLPALCVHIAPCAHAAVCAYKHLRKVSTSRLQTGQCW